MTRKELNAKRKKRREKKPPTCVPKPKSKSVSKLYSLARYSTVVRHIETESCGEFRSAFTHSFRRFMRRKTAHAHTYTQRLA